MGLQPARVYKKPPKHPYTRTSKQKKHNYIKGVPGAKISVFEVGNKGGDFDTVLELQVEEEACLRGNALEAMRVAANNYMEKQLTLEEYHLKVNVYPHHILRHNPQANIAQADRFFQGMTKPFGRPVGRGAIVDEEQTVLTLRLDEEVDEGREALRRAGNKLGTGFRIRVNTSDE